MRKLFVFVLVLVAFNLKSQIKSGGTYKDYFLEGSYLLLEDNFPMAQDNFQAAYDIDSTSANINYYLGLCYLNSATQKTKAEIHLARATQSINSATYKTDNYLERSAPPLAFYYYGKALHINYKFDEAITQFNIFDSKLGLKEAPEWKKIITREIEICHYAKELVAGPIPIQITNIGDSINSQYPDFSPVLSADERMIIYTTRRPNTTGGLKDITGYYNEDVVVSYKDAMGKWSSPQPISNNINSGGMEASVNLSTDGQTLILYKDNGDGMGGNIYYSTFDGKDWSVLKDFGSDINTKSWESHACLSSDGNVLFFVSDRLGGFGGRDIYRCVKLPNGQWSKALNMGPGINTEFDEDGAFLHPDGKTFFFASKGHKTMGGFDIMFATLAEDNNQFTDVSNIGYPINTTDDDIFFVTSPDGKRSYFSSAKAGGIGEKDIYIISIPEAKEKPLALFKGQIVPAEGEKLPSDLMIVVTDKQTGEVIGNYRPKVVNGTFSTILPPGRDYNLSYESNGESFYNEDLYVTNDHTYQEINREVNLEPVKLLGKVKAKQKAILLNVIVFDNNKHKKEIPGAKLTVTEVGGETKNFDCNNNGRYDGITLQSDKKYAVFAEAKDKKSPVSEISTMGVKSGKIINQLLYMGNKSETVLSKNILLNVAVKNKKTKKSIANANVTLTDADGNKKDVSTNDNGVIEGIELMSDTKYGLVANSNSLVSEKISFSTKGHKGAKAISKTLFIIEEIVKNSPPPSDSDVNPNLPPSEYEFFFKYNRNENDNDAIWIAFTNNIMELIGNKKSVSITINASASHVPTHEFKDNKELATTRAKNLEKRIKDAIVAKGGDISKLKFTKNAMVGGPKYDGDAAAGEVKYEKHQYVKAKAK